MSRYSVQPRDFCHLLEIGENIGKNISKNISSK